MDFIKNVSEKLGNPQHVIRFQKLCGIIHVESSGQLERTGSDGLFSPNNIDHSTAVGEPGVGHLPHRNGFQNGDVIQRKVKKDRNCNDKFSPNGYFDQPSIQREESSSSDDSQLPTNEHYDNPTHKDQCVISNRALYCIFKTAAFLGDETFYLIFYPFCIWNFDSVVGRQIGLVWAVVMYMGQATKDYLGWPRPSSPPVARLENTYMHEFSMPSTHAMAGTAIPLVLSHALLQRYEIPASLVITLALTYTIAICLSRLYLGVHTVLDVICGVVYALVISLILIPYLSDIDWYQQNYHFAPLVTVATGLTLCTWFYPKPKYTNITKADTVQIISAVIGAYLGAWLNYQCGLSSLPETRPPYAIQSVTLNWFVLSFLRYFMGAVVLGVSKVCVKFISVRATSWAMGLEKPNSKHPSVTTSYTFITYAFLGFLITSGVPYIHKLVSLDNPSYYYQVL